MAAEDPAKPPPPDQHALLKQILSTIQSIQKDHQHLFATVESIQEKVNAISGVKQGSNTAETIYPSQTRVAPIQPSSTVDQQLTNNNDPDPSTENALLEFDSAGHSEARRVGESLHGRKHGATSTSRIILTTYPGQSGIDPLTMNWGHADALKRGPVVVSRSQSTVRRRNGRQGGSLFPTVSLTSA